MVPVTFISRDAPGFLESGRPWAHRLLKYSSSLPKASESQG